VLATSTIPGQSETAQYTDGRQTCTVPNHLGQLSLTSQTAQMRVGWVTVCLLTGISSRYVPSHLGQLSLPSQTTVKHAQMRVVAELIRAKTSKDDVGVCTSEVEEVVFRPLAAAETVMAAADEDISSSIPPRSNHRYTVDSSVPQSIN